MDNSQRGFGFIGISAVALIHDGKGRLLLQKRGEQARDEEGCWDLCGGAVEFGDTIEDTIRRELQEELSTTPLAMKLLTAYDAHRTINGRSSHWVAVVYAVEVNPSTVCIAEPYKIAEIGWFNSHDLPSPRHSQFDKSFNVAKAQGIIK